MLLKAELKKYFTMTDKFWLLQPRAVMLSLVLQDILALAVFARRREVCVQWLKTAETMVHQTLALIAILFPIPREALIPAWDAQPMYAMTVQLLLELRLIM